MTDEFEFVPFETVPAKEAVDFMNRQVGDRINAPRTQAYWEWKHQRGPWGPSVGLAARDEEGALVGLRPFIPWDLKCTEGRSAVRSARAVDAIVARRVRGQGVFSSLTWQALEHLRREKRCLVFNTPNERSAPGYAKLGFRLHAHPTFGVVPASFALVRRGKSGVGSRLDRIKAALASDWSQVDGSDAALLFELATTQNRRGLVSDRPMRFWRWKYAECPNADYFVHRTSGREGAVVFRADVRRGRAGVVVAEVVGRDGQRAERDVAAWARQDPTVDYMVCDLPPAFWGRVVRCLRRGAVPVRWRNVRMATYPLTGEAGCLGAENVPRLTLGELEFL